MKYNNDLKEIIRKKEFKTFWHLLDYLLIAGYTPINAFGISLQEFGEPRIYSNVAFVRSYSTSNDIMQYANTPLKCGLAVGILDESNIYLSGLFSRYNKSLHDGKIEHEEELESACETIFIQDLTPFLMDYLNDVGQLHFGFEVLKRVKHTGSIRGLHVLGGNVPNPNPINLANRDIANRINGLINGPDEHR